MKWHNESDDNPGYSVYHATPDRDPNVLYVIRQKRKTLDFTPVGWRVFVRDQNCPELRVIFFAEKLKQAKAFAQDLEDVLAAT